jgi:hypothetical protein
MARNTPTNTTTSAVICDAKEPLTNLTTAAPWLPGARCHDDDERDLQVVLRRLEEIDCEVESLKGVIRDQEPALIAELEASFRQAEAVERAAAAVALARARKYLLEREIDCERKALERKTIYVQKPRLQQTSRLELVELLVGMEPTALYALEIRGVFDRCTEYCQAFPDVPPTRKQHKAIMERCMGIGND